MVEIAANKANYLVMYKNSAQVYSATSLSTAVNTPLPKGCTIEDRRILLLAHLPDEESLCVFPMTDEQLAVEEKPKKEKVAADVEEENG